MIKGLTDTQLKMHRVYASHLDMLKEKNRRYGDSVLDPLGVFAPHLDDGDGLLLRLDDKISRIKNSDELKKNDVSDVMGYLMLLCISKGWLDFSDQID